MKFKSFIDYVKSLDKNITVNVYFIHVYFWETLDKIL